VTDLDLGLATAEDICPGCRVHSGYLRAWRDSQQAIITTVQDALAVPGQEGFRVVTTGHSLGAGIASVAGLQLRRLGMNVDIVSFICIPLK
jgi:thioesterase domain-containing protein